MTVETDSVRETTFKRSENSSCDSRDRSDSGDIRDDYYAKVLSITSSYCNAFSSDRRAT